MKRVTNTNKSITSQNTLGNPAVPSMGGANIRITFKAIPALANFIKGHATTDLESRKAGKFKLKKYCGLSRHMAGVSTRYCTLYYKLGKTRYKIKSCTKRTKMRPEIEEGNIIISKGIFQSKKFEIKDLPVNVVASINKNIEAFNTLYESKLRDSAIKVQGKKEKKQTSFFNGLDT